MGIENFQALYDAFCAAAHTPAQPLEEDDEGCTAFSAEVEGVTVNVMHTAESHSGCAFLLVDFGPPPEERLHEVFQVLLVSNFAMLGDEGAPAFSLHPVYGNVTLQAIYPFEGRSGDHLLRAIRALATLALRWRETHFLDQATEAEEAAR